MEHSKRESGHGSCGKHEFQVGSKGHDDVSDDAERRGHEEGTTDTEESVHEAAEETPNDGADEEAAC